MLFGGCAGCSKLTLLTLIEELFSECSDGISRQANNDTVNVA
jgi:hypothetical protein